MIGTKIPISRTLPLAISQQIEQALAQYGWSLPASVTAVNGAFVTVNFEIQGAALPRVTVPIAESQYVRLPIQVGDTGLCISADALLTEVTGAGTGVATLTPPGNLSALVFLPIGNKQWVAVDGTAVTIYGKNGVVLRDTNSKTVFTLTPSGVTVTCGTAPSTSIIMTTSSMTLTAGGHSLVLNSSGLTIDSAPYLEHTHTLVQTGTSDSGPVTPA